MTVAPSAVVPARTDTSTAALRAAIHDDLVASAARRRTIAGERVVRNAGILAYACDIDSPDVNEVVEARFVTRRELEQLRATELFCPDSLELALRYLP